MTKTLILAFLFTIALKLAYGIGLNCTFGLWIFPYVDIIYLCDASIIMDVESSEKVTAVYGTHQSGRTNADVRGFRIYNRGIEFVPTNIEQFFPNINSLILDRNAISYVSNQHLNPFPNLVYLHLDNNRITSLDSYLFYGFKSIQWISFFNNDIKHVGHDFVIPDTVEIVFSRNECIDVRANTTDAVNALRFNLLLKCPPTISQIEDTLESRDNWITNMNGQVQSIVNRTDAIEQSHSELDDEVKNHTNELADLKQRNVQLTSEVAELTTEVIDLQQRNVDLTNRNSQLETRVGFLDTRAGFLEVRVAVLEGIIESKLGLKIDDVISENKKSIKEM